MLSRWRSSVSDEGVQPGEQIADLALASGQRGVEVVDDVADLAEPAAVDDGRQRRQGLLGRGIGRGLVRRRWWRRAASRPRGALARAAGRAPRAWSPADWSDRPWPRRWRAPRRRADRDLDVDVPVRERHRSDAADDDVVDQHRRIRFQRADIGELDVVDAGVGPAADGAGQRQRVQAAERASGRRQHAGRRRSTSRDAVGRSRRCPSAGPAASAGSSMVGQARRRPARVRPGYSAGDGSAGRWSGADEPGATAGGCPKPGGGGWSPSSPV